MCLPMMWKIQIKQIEKKYITWMSQTFQKNKKDAAKEQAE